MRTGRERSSVRGRAFLGKMAGFEIVRIHAGNRVVTQSYQPLPESIAAVDLGSNSFHMIVARAEEGRPVVVDRMREMVQLALGLDEERNLSREAQDRALECLRRFGQRIQHMPATSVRAVGTHTLRTARCAVEFLAEAESALGRPVETISGMEEARLIYLGVTQSLPRPEKRRLVVDIGGGSTEVIVGESFDPIRMESLYMGCVSMTRAHFADGAIQAGRWRKAKLAAQQELEPIRAEFGLLGWEQVIGASGTVRTVNDVLRNAGWSKNGITLKGLKRLRDALLKAGNVDGLELEGLSSKRRAVFVGGVALLMAIFESFGIERMQYAEGALRDGLLHDLLGRIRESDVRRRSVGALGNRYHVDWKQALRVEGTALKLLRRVADPWSLDTRVARQLLSWAAQLHEVGLDIAHAHYHKHGEYILGQSDLLGFSREEQLLLAVLVRAHRRKYPQGIVKSAPHLRPRETERLAVLLRLAVVLHRSRDPGPVPEIGVEVGKRSMKLRFPEGWLDAHALTRADLEQESSYLRAAGFELAAS